MASSVELRSHGQDVRVRLPALVVGMTLVFVVLLSRFWYLQGVRGEDYARFAARNTFKAREIPAPRGIIMDSRGLRVADVRPSFDVVIRPDLIPRAPRGRESEAPLPGEPLDIRTIARTLEAILDLPEAGIRERHASASGRARYRSVLIKSDVSRDQIARIEASRVELPGVYILTSQRRTYPYGELFSHLVGYLGEVHREQLEALRETYRETHGEDYYEIGDFIGKYGVEQQLEPYLKGRDGTYYVREDATGRVVDAFDEAEDEDYTRSMLALLSERRQVAVAGNDLRLTLDLELQRYVRDQLGEKVGTVIALEPDTGRVLALVNNPSFDPEIFARGISHQEWKVLAEDPGHPLEDKALRGLYPPASTYKMVPSVAALMEQVITPESVVYCAGGLRIGQRMFRCHKHGGHGSVSVREALKVSCDVFYYTYGARLGVDRLAQYARAFGFGAPTGLGLNQEKSGLVPDEPWKLKRFKSPWVTGDTVSASIGQGYNLVTPIQIARYTAAIANGGRLLKPYVVEQVQDFAGNVVLANRPEVVGTVPATPEVLRVVREGMLKVVEEPGGTAHRSRIPGIRSAGKTGTAQVVRQEYGEGGRRLASRIEDHALYTAYAPYEHPEIVVTVVLEHGGHGGAAAAPVARAVMEKFFRDRGRLANRVSPVSAPDAPSPAVTPTDPASALVDSDSGED